MAIQRRRKDNRAALLLVGPFVLVYLALFIYPAMQMLAISFTDGALTRPGDWVGLENYARLFRDRYFGAALTNTLYFVALTVIPGTLIGLALALAVNRLRGSWQVLALSVFFIPYTLPVSSVASIANLLTNSAERPLGNLARSANGTIIPVWLNADWFMPSLAVLTIWWTVGFNILIFLAGLRAIPHDIYEAARLDGARGWAEFRYITWPLIWPITVLVLTLQLILQIRVFDQVYLMAAQASHLSATSLVHYIFTVAFQRNQAGYASAVAVALFAFAIVAVLLQLQLLRRANSR